jgi:hypothetical protein
MGVRISSLLDPSHMRGGGEVGADVQGVRQEAEEASPSHDGSGSPSIHPHSARSSTTPGRYEEEEEVQGELPRSRTQESLPLSTIEMEVDDPSLFLHLSTPPPTATTTPSLSAEDPIGDTLKVVFNAIARDIPSSSSSLSSSQNLHPGDGWYEFIPGSAHVSLDIPSPLSGPANQGHSDNSPAKYLKATLLAGTPTLLGCQGRSHPVYSMHLIARPFHSPAPRYYDPRPIEILEHPFDMRIERALLFLGDLGVMGDIYILRSLPMRCQGLYRRKEDALQDLESLQHRLQHHHLSQTDQDHEQLRTCL